MTDRAQSLISVNQRISSSKRKKALFFWPVVCASVPLICLPLAVWLAVSSSGSRIFIGLIFPLGVTAGLSLLLALPALVGLGFQRTRFVSAVVALSCAVHFAAFVSSLQIADRIRMNAFADLAERSKPLVAAIHAYQQKRGHPPESISGLVPEFISSVPLTGMGAYPEYEYLKDTTNFHGNPWVLRVFTPSVGINFDQFLYFPLTNDPATGYGGVLRRIGDWAYVFE